ncbi:hypothetical protein PRZ48_011920 [Zasmidium cellare]|uniref:Uncharacterized protein n=1 Tax=Zasmidium cellare TaxID=395010 RepID=A0ABR0E7S5_ZASCE|nr:hypothetical protein PRZ48_011920 [Zasmidium cellare]
MSDSASSEIATMTGNQMSSSSSSSDEEDQRTPVVSDDEECVSNEDSSSPIATPQRTPSPSFDVESDDEYSSSPIATPQRTPSPKIDIDLDDEQPARDSSSSPETEIIPPRDLFFVLEEILDTSTSTFLRPATVRAALFLKDDARRVMKDLVYSRADPPAARKVCLENIFKDGVFMGEGYEFHTRSLKLRTLWIQEGVREDDAEVVESDGESVVSEGAAGRDGEETRGGDEETLAVRLQGGGARLSGGGWSLPEICGV